MHDTRARVRSCEVEEGVRRGLQKRVLFTALPSYLHVPIKNAHRSSGPRALL